MDEVLLCKAAQSVYLIQNDGEHYYAGRLNNGNQVLMDGFSRVEFDSGGNVVATSCPEDTSYTVQALDAEGSVLSAYFRPTDLPPPSVMPPFTPGTISVKPFFLTECSIGIRDLPDHLQEFLDHPENADEEERRYYPEEVKEWRERGSFVLWWNEDYFLSKEGELESS